VTAIIAPDGSLITGYTYDEFGNLTQTGESTFDNEVTFTSSITDTSTGLQYMNARYYNATTGRFLTQDTYSGNAYEPWTQHLYSYCGNNPVNMIDPTGHFWYYGNTQQSNSTSFKEAKAKAEAEAKRGLKGTAKTVTDIEGNDLGLVNNIAEGATDVVMTTITVDDSFQKAMHEYYDNIRNGNASAGLEYSIEALVTTIGYIKMFSEYSNPIGIGTSIAMACADLMNPGSDLPFIKEGNYNVYVGHYTHTYGIFGLGGVQQGTFMVFEETGGEGDIYAISSVYDTSFWEDNIAVPITLTYEHSSLKPNGQGIVP
jgi:RHS repeat-associated core domain